MRVLVVVLNERALRIVLQLLRGTQLIHDVRVTHQVVRLDAGDGNERCHHGQDHPTDPVERER